MNSNLLSAVWDGVFFAVGPMLLIGLVVAAVAAILWLSYWAARIAAERRKGLHEVDPSTNWTRTGSDVLGEW